MKKFLVVLLLVTGNGSLVTAPVGAAVRDNTAVDRTSSVEGRSTIAPQTVGTRIPRLGGVARSAGVGSRTATAPRITNNESRITTRTATTPRITSQDSRVTTRSATTPRTATRAATTARSAIDTTAPVLTRDYRTCRTVYYDCMDEFCANKDPQLKRCACSVRAGDFDATRRNFDKIEQQMLDFNERLLTVNMDREDALAISRATEGELAFATEDTSKSKSILDEIAAKLKANTADAEMTRNLSAISLTLDTDAAFDTIDSMMGAGTTTLSGAALYSAALPVCREMAAEVCQDDAFAIAESGYQMAIEQDCNTMAKTFENMNAAAMERVREGGALLDMARLDTHQTRNADDILTCKRKMLDMMTDPAVCGADLGGCLDTTGRYIDPTTGAAFLTPELANLGTVLTRPTGDQTWTTAPGNDKFVMFLNTKKIYLEPAMENCRDISTSVWNDFVADALAQIKLAQDAKLEDMRQSCTTLTTQCLNDAYKSISEFDARALSIFGVSADKTVNEMCAGVKSACTALLETTGGGGEDWIGGITEIEVDKTYDTIIATCREVGKACIIQTCKSMSGNFGLCESIDRSTNRKAILNRTSCWQEVQDCVNSADPDQIEQIVKSNTTVASGYEFFLQLYGYRTGLPYDYDLTDPNTHNYNTVKKEFYAIDNSRCASDNYACKLAERIWGHCDYPTNYRFYGADGAFLDRSEILPTINAKDETLLAWFAKGTDTLGSYNNCSDTYNRRSNDGIVCPPEYMVTIYNEFSNCHRDEGILYSGDELNFINIVSFDDTSGEYYSIGTNNLYCTDGDISLTANGKIGCGYDWATQSPSGAYYPPDSVNFNRVQSYYNLPDTQRCEYTRGTGWGWIQANTVNGICTTPDKFFIEI